MTPRQIGNYRLDRLLGSGGMGEVYKAYDAHRDRYVALKLLPEAFSGDREYLKRFQRESHVAARLREPHVIPIHDFGEIDGRLFIDMRLVDGADMGALLDMNGRIAPQRAVYLLSQVAQALDAAHTDGLVHRDIKPSNILVTLSDFVYVVDFGVARSIGGRQTSLTITGATIGTLDYMAPERFADQAIDGRVDVYSLACMLHECLTGIPPFRGKDLPSLIYAHLYSSPPPASSIVDGVPPALDAVIARGMAKDPEDRFPTAGALAAAAGEALTEAPAPLTEVQAPPRTEMQAPPRTEMQAPPRTEMQAPPRTEMQAPPRTEIPAPTRRTPAGVTAFQSVVKPPRVEPEPAGDRSAEGVPYSPTQSLLADSVNFSGGTRPAENMPQSTGPEPDGSRPPPGVAPGRSRRGPARRRLSVLILVAAAAIAVPVAFVIASAKPNVTVRPDAAGVSIKPDTGGATGTGTAGAASSAPASASVAVPTVAEKIAVGQTPNFIQVAPDGKFAYIANPAAGVITVLNTAKDQVSGIINIPQGPPQFVSFSPDGRTAYVSIYNASESVHLIAFIDTASNTVTSTVSVNNDTPGPAAASPDGQYLYVPNHNMMMGMSNGNVIDVIDTASKKLTGGIAVPANPHVIVFGQNGRFYASDHMSGVVTVLNAHNNKVITYIQVGETPHGEAISPDGSRLAVTSYDGNEVFLINTATDKVVARVPVGKNPQEITYSPDGRYLYTVNNESNTVTVIDTADNRVTAEVPTGKAPTSISVLPNGRQAYVSDEGDGTIEVLNIGK
jgi:YVTN family beta-propeller protein